MQNQPSRNYATSTRSKSKSVNVRVPRSHPKSLLDNHQPANVSTREILKSWLARDPKSVVLALVLLVNLVIGVIQFAHIGNTSMLISVLDVASIYSGIEVLKKR